MAEKENKGGLLTTEQVEQDNAVKGKATEGGHFQGSQDTGDKKERQSDTLQPKDGRAANEKE